MSLLQKVFFFSIFFFLSLKSVLVIHRGRKLFFKTSLSVFQYDINAILSKKNLILEMDQF